MDTLYVNWPGINQTASELSRMSDRLKNISREISSVRSRMAFSGAYSSSMSSRLNNISETVSDQSRIVLNMSQTLTSVGTRYRNCEASVAQECTDSLWDKIFSSPVIKKSIWDEGVYIPPGLFDVTGNPDGRPAWLELLNKLLGEFGAIGKPFAVWFDLSGEDRQGLDIFLTGGKGAAGIAGVIGAWMMNGMGSEDLAKYLLGINMKNIPKNTTFWKALQQEFSEYILENGDDMTTAAKVGNKLSVGAKWAGEIFGFFINASDNYGEYSEGDITGGRAVLETIFETGVDVGTDAGLNAGAAAILSALGVTGAPAVAVGAGVIVVKWGLDESFIYFFGKDFSETISDGVLDFGEAVFDGAQEVWDDVSDFASEKWNDAKDFASEKWDDFTDFASEKADQAADMINDAKEAVSDAADDARKAVGDAVNDAKEGIYSAWNNFTEWAF